MHLTHPHPGAPPVNAVIEGANMSDLAGSVAVVTGAAQGIGRSIALRLAADGADIAVIDINGDQAQAVVDEIAALGRRAIAVTADVSDRDQVFAAVDRTRSELGSLDVMVNNAGTVQVEPLLDVTPENFKHILAVNLESVMWGTQAAAQSFVETGTKGAIINASAGAGHEGFGMLSAYCATKFGIRALTQAAAKEFGTHGITVNAYCPGIVDTSMWIKVDEEFARHSGVAKGATFDQFVSMITLGRAETPEDVAGLVSYLASQDGRYMTGQSLIIDGGILYR